MDTDILNLITRFKDFPVLERKPSFLEIAGFPNRETVWRNIFAFFFDPSECHGLKDLFLRSFFDALGKPGRSTGDFDSVSVRTECQTSKGKYLDLLITCDEFAIGIEMKVNAPLYNDLEDYAALVKAKSPAEEYKVVLSIAPCNAYGGFENLLYSEFIPAIRRQFGNYLLAADPTYTSFLFDFLNHVTRYIGGYAMTIDPKQLQFMRDNHETVQRVIKAHNDIRRLLEERMAQVNDAVASLDSLKAFVLGRERLFTYEGTRLSKINFLANQIQLWYQFSMTEDYCIKTHFWIEVDGKCFDDELGAKGFKEEKLDLSMPIETMVASTEKTLLSIIAYLSSKQSPPAAH